MHPDILLSFYQRGLAPWLQTLNADIFFAPLLAELKAVSHTNKPLSITSLLNHALSFPFYKQGILATTKQQISFVDQEQLPKEMAYEEYIALYGKIPTRSNWHDFFNALIWFTFPQIKSAFNKRHIQEIKAQNDRLKRTALRDAITLLDENGVILTYTEPQHHQALIQFDWNQIFITNRDVWDNPQESIKKNKETQLKAFICGHALLEQLLQPRKNLCGHAWLVQVSSNFYHLSNQAQLAELDHQLAKHFLSENWTTRSLQPVPVMGIPHFFIENQDEKFYQDKSVFREGRRQKPMT